MTRKIFISPIRNNKLTEVKFESVEELVKALEEHYQPHEMAFSLVEFNENIRKKVNCRRAYGICGDVDYHLQGKKAVPSEYPELARLPDVNFAYRTPHGFRYGVVFDEPCNDLIQLEGFGRKLASVVEKELQAQGFEPSNENGLSVDPASHATRTDDVPPQYSGRGGG